MRVTLQELMEKLGVGHVLSPYETFPSAATDLLTGKTMSAEVRMSPDADEVECEVQLLLENPEPGQASIEHLLWMQIQPFIQSSWCVKNLRVRNEVWNDKVYNWEEKSCNLFRAIVTEMAMGNMPDFDELLDREVTSKERFGDQRGGGAGKSPKIRPGQLLNMKTGF